MVILSLLARGIRKKRTKEQGRRKGFVVNSVNQQHDAQQSGNPVQILRTTLNRRPEDGEVPYGYSGEKENLTACEHLFLIQLRNPINNVSAAGLSKDKVQKELMGNLRKNKSE